MHKNTLSYFFSFDNVAFKNGLVLEVQQWNAFFWLLIVIFFHIQSQKMLLEISGGILESFSI